MLSLGTKGQVLAVTRTRAVNFFPIAAVAVAKWNNSWTELDIKWSPTSSSSSSSSILRSSPYFFCNSSVLCPTDSHIQIQFTETNQELSIRPWTTESNATFVIVPHLSQSPEEGLMSSMPLPRSTCIELLFPVQPIKYIQYGHTLYSEQIKYKLTLKATY